MLLQRVSGLLVSISRESLSHSSYNYLLRVDLVPRSCRAQELCESRGGRPGLPVPNKPTVSVDVK